MQKLGRLPEGTRRRNVEGSLLTEVFLHEYDGEEDTSGPNIEPTVVISRMRCGMEFVGQDVVCSATDSGNLDDACVIGDTVTKQSTFSAACAYVMHGLTSVSRMFGSVHACNTQSCQDMEEAEETQFGWGPQTVEPSTLVGPDSLTEGRYMREVKTELPTEELSLHKD